MGRFLQWWQFPPTIVYLALWQNQLTLLKHHATSTRTTLVRISFRLCGNLTCHYSHTSLNLLNTFVINIHIPNTCQNFTKTTELLKKIILLRRATNTISKTWRFNQCKVDFWISDIPDYPSYKRIYLYLSENQNGADTIFSVEDSTRRLEELVETQSSKLPGKAEAFHL